MEFICNENEKNSVHMTKERLYRALDEKRAFVDF